jgi:AbrB family looped-hinge helix DNA binding protein
MACPKNSASALSRTQSHSGKFALERKSAVLNMFRAWINMKKSIFGDGMVELTTVVGERGQITIPKPIRQREGLQAKDRVAVKIEGNRIVIEKTQSKKQKQEQMMEGYKKLAAASLKTEDEWKYTSKEADEMLDEY